MKKFLWVLGSLAVLIGGASGYLFIGGHTPIGWSKVGYTESVAEASKAGRPVLLEFHNQL